MGKDEPHPEKVPETALGDSNLTDHARLAFLPLSPPRQSICSDARLDPRDFTLPSADMRWQWWFGGLPLAISSLMI